jgi:predicted outer membrane repeat protein
VSFLQNDIYYTDSETQDVDFDSVAPITISDNSILIISGVASFVHNRAIAQGKEASGGAIYAVYQSRVIFEETSRVSFIKNSAASYGGAIYVSQSNLTMHGRVLFESNFAGLGGGAIAINNGYYDGNPLARSVINCSGNSIIFRNNTSHGSGGAIYAMSQYSDSDITVGLKDVLFEGNTATLDGGGCLFIQ